MVEDNRKVELTLTRDEVVDAKDQMDGEDQEAFLDYLNELASFSKEEAEQKEVSLATREKARNAIQKQFPDRDVDLMDVRRAIRKEFHKKA